MNHKQELEKLIIRYENSPMSESEFLYTIRKLINSIDQPATLEVKDNLRIEIATKIMAGLISGGLNIYDAKNECEVVFEIADAIIESGKAK